MPRTFFFETPADAARFVEPEGLPYAWIVFTERNANGIGTRCRITVPAELFAPVSA